MSSLQDYLKKYESSGGDGASSKGFSSDFATSDQKRKKRKIIGSTSSSSSGAKKPNNLKLHDDDADWSVKPVEDDDVLEKITAGELSRTDGPVVVDFDTGPQFSGVSTFQTVSTKELAAPPRRARHDSNSPPRRARHDSNSPPRRARHDSNSPPRRARHDSNSPPRRARHDSNSPPRRSRHESNSPPRRPSQDFPSPPRRPAPASSSDNNTLSPPRKASVEQRDLSPPRKSGGVVRASELKEFNRQVQAQQEKKFAEMGQEELGVGAETVHRDKSGRRLDPKLERLRKREEEAKKREKEEAQMKWGKGLAQSELREERLKYEVEVMEKPFARTIDDDDLNKMLKEEIRAEDPMAAYMLEQKAKRDKDAGKKVRPRYMGPPPPPNRFGILPGHLWDGRDRSNGFEAKRFTRQSERRAHATDAYKWRSEDM